MVNKYKTKFQILFWNSLFIILGVSIIFTLHGYITLLSNLIGYTSNLINKVGKSIDIEVANLRPKNKFTEINFDSSLNFFAEEVFTNGVLLILLFVFLFLLVGIVYILLIRLSTLAVNRKACMWLVTSSTIIGISLFEFQKFIASGDGFVFAMSTSSIIIIMFYTLFISMEPQTQSSPYYRSKTELIEYVPLAA